MPFPPQGSGAVAGILEATYNTWNHVWNRDYGAGADLAAIDVTDDGTIYAWDGTANSSHLRTLAGDEINLANYMFWITAIGFNTRSRTGRYHIAINTALPALEMWRDDAMIWSHDPTLDLADFSDVMAMFISSSGEFLGIIAVSTATANARYVMLYRGA